MYQVPFCWPALEHSESTISTAQHPLHDCNTFTSSCDLPLALCRVRMGSLAHAATVFQGGRGPQAAIYHLHSHAAVREHLPHLRHIHGALQIVYRQWDEHSEQCVSHICSPGCCAVQTVKSSCNDAFLPAKQEPETKIDDRPTGSGTPIRTLTFSPW